MMPPDMLDEESSSSRCRGGSERGYEVGSFGYWVHHYHDCIVTRGFWEFHDEIHADRIPGWGVGGVLQPGASVAVALAGVFAILINKIYKIMEIFE